MAKFRRSLILRARRSVYHYLLHPSERKQCIARSQQASQRLSLGWTSQFVFQSSAYGDYPLLSSIDKDDIFFQCHKRHTPADEMIFKRTPSPVGRKCRTYAIHQKYLEKKSQSDNARSSWRGPDKYEMWRLSPNHVESLSMSTTQLSTINKVVWEFKEPGICAGHPTLRRLIQTFSVDQNKEKIWATSKNL